MEKTNMTKENSIPMRYMQKYARGYIDKREDLYLLPILQTFVEDMIADWKDEETETINYYLEDYLGDND